MEPSLTYLEWMRLIMKVISSMFLCENGSIEKWWNACWGVQVVATRWEYLNWLERMNHQTYIWQCKLIAIISSLSHLHIEWEAGWNSSIYTPSKATWKPIVYAITTDTCNHYPLPWTMKSLSQLFFLFKHLHFHTRCSDSDHLIKICNSRINVFSIPCMGGNMTLLI